jgi:hypothetical protein
VAALLLPLSSSSFAQCSLNTVHGIWGYQSHGTVMTGVPGSSTPVPVPFAGLGIMKIDYQGRYTVHGTISVGGQVQNVDYSGSIQVNPDCTATDTYTSGSLQGADRLVILDNGNEMRSMPTTFPLGPAAGMFYFRRVAWGEAQCGGDMVHGVYAGPREGSQMAPVPGQSQPVAVPFSAIHTATLQYGGAGTAASTASLGGAIVDFEFPAISMAVNPDCTATMKFTGVSKQFPGQTFTGTVKYIVLNYGNELIGLDTEANTGLPAVVLDNLKRISMLPIVPDR